VRAALQRVSVRLRLDDVACFARARRCADAFASFRLRSNARMGRIKALRWTVGGGLPPDLSAALSPSERDFFSAYNRRAPQTL
jgi:hypothetical protein